MKWFILQLQIFEEQGKRLQLESSRRFAKTLLIQLKESENEARAELNEKEKELTNHIENARKIAINRMENIRTVPVIVARIDELEKNVRQIESQVVKPEKLKAQYDAMHEKYLRTQGMWEDLKKEAEELRSAYICRKEHFRKIRKYFIRLITFEFEKVLEFRHFKGTVNVNIEEGTLDLIVIPHQGSQGVIKNSNLSGGERSFTTVAFLYALWNCTNLPFYILDEFDVYMVGINLVYKEE